MTAKAENSEGNPKNVESDDEVSQPKLPTPELPDDTPISEVEFPARIRNVLAAAGLKTVGEVRETSDETLLSFQDFGKGSVVLLRDPWDCRLVMALGPWAEGRPDLLNFQSALFPIAGKLARSAGLQRINPSHPTHHQS